MVSATDRLSDPNAVLTRTDLAALGWPRRGIDAIFRNAGAIVCLAIRGQSSPSPTTVPSSRRTAMTDERKSGRGMDACLRTKKSRASSPLALGDRKDLSLD